MGGTAPTAGELVEHAGRARAKAAAAGAIVPEQAPVLTLADGRIITRGVVHVGVYAERQEAVVEACQHTPALISDLGGSWAVYRLQGGQR